MRRQFGILLTTCAGREKGGLHPTEFLSLLPGSECQDFDTNFPGNLSRVSVWIAARCRSFFVVFCAERPIAMHNVPARRSGFAKEDIERGLVRTAAPRFWHLLLIMPLSWLISWWVRPNSVDPLMDPIHWADPLAAAPNKAPSYL